MFSIEADFEPDAEKQACGLRLLLCDATDSAGVFVAEGNKEIVGMCTVQTVVSTAKGGRAGLLEDLIVRGDQRRERVVE